MELQSTLPARGATPLTRSWMPAASRFQSTLPVRGATMRPMAWMREKIFQSALPVRGATVRHTTGTGIGLDFNPRSPRGERPWTWEGCRAHGYFNPRSPWRERPPGYTLRECSVCGISIHAPRGESDPICAVKPTVTAQFQSTLPVRGATLFALPFVLTLQFQPTLPARGAT